jgi:hypothetical protein
VMHINFWLLRIQLLWMQLKILCDSNMLRWRFPYSYDVSCVTDCQQRRTWLVVALYYHKLNFWVLGCGGVELTQHLFLSCNTFAFIWALVRSWIGFSVVDSPNLPDHFVQFIYSVGGFRARRSFLQLIWLTCAWVVEWKKW